MKLKPLWCLVWYMILWQNINNNTCMCNYTDPLIEWRDGGVDMGEGGTQGEGGHRSRPLFYWQDKQCCDWWKDIVVHWVGNIVILNCLQMVRIFLSSAYVVSTGPICRNSVFLFFFHSVSNFLGFVLVKALPIGSSVPTVRSYTLRFFSVAELCHTQIF